jgi:putative DNA methylase
MAAFIETQFPIARLSAESYKERKAGASQTLTGLGKWWGRKPLILVRASILGMLMPASDDAKKDREIFLKILTMDDDGTWERCRPAIKRKVSKAEFLTKSYAERITDCERPENISGPTAAAWAEINLHLHTNAKALPELVEQLGEKTLGHLPKVGDSFCGGGSIPFEALRIGCESYGSDLNPVAGLLTWGSVQLLGLSVTDQVNLNRALRQVYEDVDSQISDLGIEFSAKGERAEAYLYCVEVKPEGCDYFIPLAPSWLVSEKYRIVVDWQRAPGSTKLNPIVREVSDAELGEYKKKKGATFVGGRIVDPFDGTRSWSIESIRGSNGLRLWVNDDFEPQPNDVFQERLYCVRWVDSQGNRRFSSPDQHDLEQEKRVSEELRRNFAEWQSQGFIPRKQISKGYNTDQPTRERGWTHWHHLFTPRQLLAYGLYLQALHTHQDRSVRIAGLLKLGIQANWNSKLCIWNPDKSKGPGSTEQTFANQALNTLVNYGTRSYGLLGESLTKEFSYQNLPQVDYEITVADARDVRTTCDLWITDPPYADAVNYHELADFFLAWFEKPISRLFPDWVVDSRSELAVRGDGDDFRRSMVEVYQNLAKNMSDNGLQMVQFTHQNPAVWADLGMILWAAGLKVTAAWTISTETSAGLKQGNYVQGTVCLILRKRANELPGFLDEIYPLVEDEVKNQISSMQNLDEGSEPNFNDADYQLAAYAAALKILTRYSSIDGRDVEHEVFARREKSQVSDFQSVIERALGIACNVLIPKGLDSVWRDLSLVERYYLRALDIESRGERRNGMYEELARGFGVTDIKPLLKSDKANGARMYTPSGLAGSNLAPVGSAEDVAAPAKRGRGSSGAPHPFASSSLRHLLFAIRETAAADNLPDLGRQYLRDTFGQGYWSLRERFVALLEWFTELGNAADMPEWAEDAEAARILAGRLRNDHA